MGGTLSEMAMDLQDVLGFEKSETPEQAGLRVQRKIKHDMLQLDRQLAEFEKDKRQAAIALQQAAKMYGGNNKKWLMGLARTIVILDNGITSCLNAKSQLQGIDIIAKTATTMASVTKSVVNVGQLLAGLNRQVPILNLRKTVMMFNQNAEKMTVKQELLDECLSDLHNELNTSYDAKMEEEGDDPASVLVQAALDHVLLEQFQETGAKAPVPPNGATAPLLFQRNTLENSTSQPVTIETKASLNGSQDLKRLKPEHKNDISGPTGAQDNPTGYPIGPSGPTGAQDNPAVPPGPPASGTIWTNSS